MSVVSPELRVGAFERRVPAGLGLLDTVRATSISHCIFSCSPNIANNILSLELWPGDGGGGGAFVPVLVVLLRLIMLRRVLGFCTTLELPK